MARSNDFLDSILLTCIGTKFGKKEKAFGPANVQPSADFIPIRFKYVFRIWRKFNISPFYAAKT